MKKKKNTRPAQRQYSQPSYSYSQPQYAQPTYYAPVRKKKKKKVNRKKQRRRFLIVAITFIVVIAVALFGVIKGVNFVATKFFSQPKQEVAAIIQKDAKSISKDVETATKDSASTSEKKATKEDNSSDLDELNEAIKSYVEEKGYDISQISYTIKDLKSNATTGSDNAEEYMLAGSVYKLPLCMLWYDKVAAGKASLDDKLVWSEEVTESGGNLENLYEQGDEISLGDVLKNTLIYSDNVGGHILYESYGGWSKFKEDAAKYSSHEQGDEFYSQVNYLNSVYMTDVMERLYKNQDKYADAISYLKVASPDDYLNHNIQVNMVQKVGWYEDHVNSCGLSLIGEPYIFCVFTNYGDDALKVMGALNEIVYTYFNEGRITHPDLIEKETDETSEDAVEESTEESTDEVIEDDSEYTDDAYYSDEEYTEDYE